MNKKYIFWIFLVIASIIGFIYFYTKNTSNKTNEQNYNAERTSQNIMNNTAQNSVNENNTTPENATEQNTEQNTVENNEVKEESDTKETKKEPSKEAEITSFTTKIYTKESGRQNNITIACSTLNNTTIENGKAFSFSKTVGRATSGKGYKKADVFRNGDVVDALGGGLCQVSTTLYNAVLKVKDLKVTERHPHSNKVPYIKSGKDAAVSYGAQDFKFVNNTGNTIKIKASNTKNNVTIKILKVE